MWHSCCHCYSPSDRGFGLGHTHVAQFSRSLEARDQTAIAMVMLRDIEANNGRILINSAWFKVLWGPVFRYEGESDTSFAEGKQCHLLCNHYSA